MGIPRTVARNTLVLVIGQLASRVITALVGIYLVRYLGSLGLGKFSVVLAYLLFFRIFADFGLDVIVVREISKDKARTGQIVGNATTLKLGLSVLAMVMAWIALFFMHYPSDVKACIYVASFGIPLSLGTLYGALFQARLRMEYPVAIDVLIQFLSAGLTLLLIIFGASIMHLFILNVWIALLNTLLMLALARKHTQLNLRFETAVWRRLLAASWPIALQAIFVTIYMRIDQLLLFQVKGEEALGYYSAAVRLTEFARILPLAFIGAVFPLMSSFAAHSEEPFIKAYQRSFKYMATLIAPITVGVTLLAKPLIFVIYGREFLPSASALAVLIWSEVVAFLGVINNKILIATDKQKWDALFTGAIAVVNVVLCIALIPRYSFIGASLATTLSHMVGPLIGYLVPATRAYSRDMFRSLVKPFVASLLMAFPIRYFAHSLLLSILFGALTYLATLVVIGGIDKEDLSLGKKAVMGT